MEQSIFLDPVFDYPWGMDIDALGMGPVSDAAATVPEASQVGDADDPSHDVFHPHSNLDTPPPALGDPPMPELGELPVLELELWHQFPGANDAIVPGAPYFPSLGSSSSALNDSHDQSPLATEGSKTAASGSILFPVPSPNPLVDLLPLSPGFQLPYQCPTPQAVTKLLPDSGSVIELGDNDMLDDTCIDVLQEPDASVLGIQKAPRMRATQLRFEKAKAQIHELYMDSNYALPMVMELMKEKHGFTATPRMYKAQFERWGWHKFRSKRQRRDPNAADQRLRGKGRSCIRRDCPPKTKRSPVPARLAADDVMEDCDRLVTILVQILDASAEKDDRWRTRPKFQRVGPTHWGYNHEISLACARLNQGDNMGFRLLNRAFDRITREIANFDFDMVSDLVVRTPVQLLFRRRGDILRILLDFLAQLSAVVLGRHHQLALAVSAARSIFEKVETQSDEFLECLGICSRAWTDRTQRHRGGFDREVLGQWRGMHRQPTRAELERLAGVVDEMVSAATEQYGELCVYVMGMESDFLQIQWLHRIYLDSYLGRVRGLLERWGRRIVSGSANHWDLDEYFVWQRRLAEYVSSDGVVESAGDSLDEVIARLEELDIKKDCSSIVDTLEANLRWLGRHEDADRIHQRWLRSEFIRELEEEYAPIEEEFLANYFTQQLTGHVEEMDGQDDVDG